MKNESGIILSIPQLRICLNLFDCPGWDDLPLADTGETPEQRLMNAFLGLIQAGWFVSTPDGYEPKADFRSLIVHIGQAECVYQLHDGIRVWAMLYEKAGSVAAIVPDRGNWESCRVLPDVGATAREAAQILAEGRQDLVLRRQDAAAKKPGEYEITELEFFFGGRMEEAK